MYYKILVLICVLENLIIFNLSKDAKCVLFPNKDSNITGEVSFSQESSTFPTTVTAKVYGVKSIHGFHIHEFPAKNEDCMTAGNHYNPLNMTHGGPADDIRHNGDLGNLKMEDGKSVIDTKFIDRIITLYGKYSIVGRTCVIHALEDDLGKDGKDSKINGNAGPRLACGIVEVNNSTAIVILCFFFLFVAIFGLFFYIYYKSQDFHSIRQHQDNIVNREEVKYN